MRERFESESSRDAVQLMTYHSAKGLEFDVVFMPQVEEREIPYWRALDEDKVAEERRLFYVGLTRAKRELYVSWSRRRERSRFLDELLPAPAKPPAPVPRRHAGKPRKRRKSWKGSSTTPPSGGPKLSPDSWRASWMRQDD